LFVVPQTPPKSGTYHSSFLDRLLQHDDTCTLTYLNDYVHRGTPAERTRLLRRTPGSPEIDLVVLPFSFRRLVQRCSTELGASRPLLNRVTQLPSSSSARNSRTPTPILRMHTWLCLKLALQTSCLNDGLSSQGSCRCPLHHCSEYKYEGLSV
jgi:hypothetical protein